jgi:phage shock protein C
MRSSRERMWAGVAGGMAEYFDLDPALVRLMWVAVTVVSHGLAVPVYILAWIVLPRDDRPPSNAHQPWRDWSEEFHSETQRLADEARRSAGSWGAQPSSPPTGPRDAATEKGVPASYTEPIPPPSAPSYGEPAQQPAWGPPPGYIDPHRHHYGRSPRTGGIILVGLGVLLLAANAGLFAWIDWHTLWPLVLIGLGLLLLVKQFDRRR